MNPYQAIINALASNSVEYYELQHDPVYSSEETAKIEGISIEECAKSLLLKAKGEFILVVMSGHKSLHSKKFKKQNKIRDLRFASPAEVKDKLGCIVGACHPFGSSAGIRTFMDKSMMSQQNIAFNPGLHHKTIKISLVDYLKLERPIILDITRN